MAQIIGTWFAAFLTLAILSFLYKDNPIYKAAEHLYVGASAAYAVIYVYFFDVKPLLLERFANSPVLERWLLVIPGFMGLLMLTRFIPKYAYISRIPISFTVGMGAGLGITAAFQGFLIPQLQSTLIPIVVWSTNGFQLMDTINNIIMVVGVLCTLTYFYFSKPHTGILGHSAKLGIVYIMVAFGAAFGYTFMARVSLLIGRVYFLVHDWLALV